MSWPQTRFGDLYLIPSRNGLMRPSRVRGEGIKMVNMGELFANQLIGDIPMERVPMNEREVANSSLAEGDLLFARQSLVLEGAGQCSYIASLPEPTTFESHLIRVRLDQAKAIPLFYHYYFRSPYSGMSTIVQQCAQAGIRASELTELKVGYPPIEVQKAVVDLLAPYDTLIENNRRRMALLEESARLLYREWFVRLRFPGYEHTPIVDGVPQGWERKTLESVCLSGNGIQTGPFGSQLHQADYSEEGVPVVMPKDIIDFRVSVATIARIPEGLADSLGRHRMILGDIVYGRRGDIGRRAFIGKRQQGWFCGTGSLRLRPDPQAINPLYLFDHLGTPAAVGDITNRAKGSTMLNLSAAALKPVPVLVPSRTLQEMYAEQTEFVREMVEVLNEQNQKLRTARDLLLPRLMSGELAI